MSHWVTSVAGCSDYSFLWPPEREKEMVRVEVSMLQWQARFILQVGHERSCIATMVSNWAMMQRNLEALCRALESLDPEERSVEVKWPFRGFTARYDKFQRNKWLLARQRAHGEGGSCALFVGCFNGVSCIFFVRVESEKCSENIQKASQEICYEWLWYTVAALDSETPRHRYLASGVKELATHPSALIGRSRVPAIGHVTNL